MSDSQGKFCWYELMTTDTAAAEAFYKTAIGWGAQDAAMPGGDYTLLTVAGVPVGGLMALPEEARKMGAGPGWVGYIWVENVDEAAARIKSAGGAIYRPADDIPGIGRFAVVADPQGAAFVLFRDANADRPAMPAPGTPGMPCWRELHAGDGASAFEFYAGQFGWTKAEAFDMGPDLGVYQLFAAGDAAIGGMMTKMKAEPRPSWLYYFATDDVDATAKRVTGAGGTILNGPDKVPGDAWIVQCLDPQGAMFAFVGARPSAS